MKKNYLVSVISVNSCEGQISESGKEIRDFSFDSFFDAVYKFETLVGTYVYNGGNSGTFSCYLKSYESFNLRRVIICTSLFTYYISLYDFNK